MSGKLTIFQKLNKIFTPDGVNVSKHNVKKYQIDDNVIFKTKDKDEYERVKNELHQNKYLANLWRKVDNELYQKSMHYETNRIGSYSDFEAMDFYPEIAAALDTFAEESTTVNDKGRVLNVYSKSDRVKSILEDLFFNRLDIHTTLPMWTRNTCKYGDNFVYLNIDNKNGIIGAKQLPNFEIERREGDIFKKDNENKIKFIWRGRDLEFNSWQIAHFRLLGDDRKLPYGTSVLEKARRIWKQLVLSEDAMLIYRVTRAPERRVYKIYVGNIDNADVPAYIDEMANRFKRTPIIDPQTGQIDLNYNQLANDQDFFIPVRDENAPTPIDTLPGAQNLNDIADIEYLQKKLFVALRVPKTFLGFDEAVGEGKNLALVDIRFSRTINRIQQAMLLELNKIAIIHLFLTGLEDELDNFTLTLNNPSTQSEILKIEQLQAKVTLFKDAVSDSGNGFSVMSMTRAKKEILGWSEDEIKQDLLEQRLERAASAELSKTEEVIKHTGLFDSVDNIYGVSDRIMDAWVNNDDDSNSETTLKPNMGGGGMPDLTSISGGEETPEFSGDEESTEEGGEPEKEPSDEEGVLKENFNKKILTENKFRNRGNKKYFENLINSINKNDEVNVLNERVKIIDKSLKINDNINKMINDIDKLTD